MTSEIFFLVLVAAVAIQRAVEVSYSRRNVRAMLKDGGREHVPEQMKWMALLHGAWLIAMPLEVLAFERPFVWPLAVFALVVFAVGQALRYAAIRALGRRWTVRVVTYPGEPVVTGGIFRYLRHPNYLGVALEIAALPLVHGAYLTAVVFSLLNALVLKRRIAAEEAALRHDTDYDEAFRDQPRIVPVLRPRRGEAP